MPSIDAVCGVLARLAPLRLAESWDNVGLLIGDRRQSVERIVTCLTISPCVVREAVDQKVQLIVTHHPLPFKPLSRITADTVTGSMLLELIGNGIAVYSAHTAFDSAADGINQMWSQLLGLTNVEPLLPWEDPSAERNPAGGSLAIGAGTLGAGTLGAGTLGAGRFGRLSSAEPLGRLVARAAQAVNASAPRLAGDADRAVTKVALACGSGGSFLSAAARHGCDAMITGEATFHVCLEAESRGIGLGLLGHYCSERFAMERLADSLAQELRDVTVWPSQTEHDPLSPVERSS